MVDIVIGTFVAIAFLIMVYRLAKASNKNNGKVKVITARDIIEMKKRENKSK